MRSNIKSERGITLLEVLAVILVVFFCTAEFLLGLERGVWDSLIGAIIGAMKGFAIYAAIMFCLMRVLRIGLLYRPTFPRCKNGKCSHSEYKYIAFVESDPVPEEITLPKDATGLLARCRCGTLYLNDMKLGQICELREDGELIPFMCHTTTGRWRPAH